MAASTLLRLLKPRLLSLCEHLGCIMQIFAHSDIGIWGRIYMSLFKGSWFLGTSLVFETLVFGTSGILSMLAQSACNTPKRKYNLKSHHTTPLMNFL